MTHVDKTVIQHMKEHMEILKILEQTTGLDNSKEINRLAGKLKEYQESSMDNFEKDELICEAFGIDF